MKRSSFHLPYNPELVPKGKALRRSPTEHVWQQDGDLERTLRWIIREELQPHKKLRSLEPYLKLEPQVKKKEPRGRLEALQLLRVVEEAVTFSAR